MLVDPCQAMQPSSEVLASMLAKQLMQTQGDLLVLWAYLGEGEGTEGRPFLFQPSSASAGLIWAGGARRRAERGG